MRDLLAGGLRLSDQVQFDAQARDQMRHVLEPAARDTVLYRQLSDSSMTVVAKQIDRVLKALRAEAGLTSPAGEPTDRPGSFGRQQLEVLRELAAAHPFATLGAQFQSLFDPLVAESLVALESLGTPSALPKGERETLEQQVITTVQLLSAMGDLSE